MTDAHSPKTTAITCCAERVLAVDPARVWALVADPGRTGEWAGFETIGYMGTELPKRGQVVFVRAGRTRRQGSPRRVEIDAWEAGAGYSCKIEGGRWLGEMHYSVHIEPEVTAAEIRTQVRLEQRAAARRALAPVLRLYIARRLRRQLDAINRIAGS